MFGLAVLTVSTSGSQGKRDDSSGQAIKDLLEGDDFQVVRYEIVSDDKDTISAKLAEWADAEDVDLIVSTGGTGLGRYDVTPEACLAILDKEVPGMAEAMRAKTLEFTPMAMISRSVTGIRGNTLIITLPGSTKAVQECLDVVMPVMAAWMARATSSLPVPVSPINNTVAFVSATSSILVRSARTAGLRPMIPPKPRADSSCSRRYAVSDVSRRIRCSDSIRSLTLRRISV